MKPALSKKYLWDIAPKPAKALAGKALSLVPLPWILGGDFRRNYRLALEADRWDAERIREYQFQQVRRMLAVAYEKTAFYRESFQSVGFEPGDFHDLTDLRKLPRIDKTVVRENWERMLTRPIASPGVSLVTTGGTSGEPMRFYMSSSRHAPEFAHLTSAWSRAGYRVGDPMAVLRGRLIKVPVKGMHYEYDPLFRHHYYSTFHMAPGDLRNYLDHMHRVKPRFIHAYPSSLFALAKFMRAEGLNFPSSIRAALLESEPVLPLHRELIEGKMGLRLFSCYGHSEKLVMAANCESSNHYHVLPTYGYCEVLKEDGTTTGEGGTGDLTGTGFVNDVMPFIRYGTGDQVVQGSDRCEACGRHHMQITSIEGRWGQEFLVCRDGSTLIYMTSLNLHDDTFDGIARFQLVQDRPGEAVLLLVPVPGAPRDAGKFSKHFAPKLGHGVDLSIQFVDEIPLTRAGKQPMILQRCAGADAIAGG